MISASVMKGLMESFHLRSDSIGGESFEKGLKVGLGGIQARDFELVVQKLF